MSNEKQIINKLARWLIEDLQRDCMACREHPESAMKYLYMVKTLEEKIKFYRDNCLEDHEVK